MTDELVHVAVDDAVATITLDSPANRNALSRQLVEDLNRALDVAEAGVTDGSVRAIVLTHVPPAFCAGADLKERRTGAAGLLADGARPAPADGRRRADDRRRRRPGPRRGDRPHGVVRPRRRAARPHVRPHRGPHRRRRGDHLRADPAPGRAAAGWPRRSSPASRSTPPSPATSGWSPTSPTTSRRRSPRCATASAWVPHEPSPRPSGCCARSPASSATRRSNGCAPSPTSCSPAPTPPRGWPPSPRSARRPGSEPTGG